LVGGIGAIGIGVLGVVIKYQVSPWPAFPFDWLLVIGAGLIAVAVALPLLSAPLRRSVAASQLFRLTPAGADEEVATAA
ncbi:MAG TPA: hypothetical protein VFO60_00525, partial [Candidatus Dormibacteraeota bacterium]|nr:hypothetical protein [Candidatus Dormibacteraeota bacterium]